MYAFSTESCPYDDLRPVTQAILDAYGPERLLLPRTSLDRVEPGYAETIAAGKGHFDGWATRSVR